MRTILFSVVVINVGFLTYYLNGKPVSGDTIFWCFCTLVFTIKELVENF
jgi:hypothetical protein